MYQLRGYQQAAVDAALLWLKSTIQPGLIEAFTAAGKSLIIAEIAKQISGMTGKKVLVLQPNKELLTQNAAKFKQTGNPCSMFSASVGQKSVRHNVVYGTALTIKNKLDSFCGKFCLVILDEADASLTPTILSIIDHMRGQNPNLRVLGCTGTPYKLKTGFIYKVDHNDRPVPEDQCIEPFFTKKIVDISGRYLLDNSYITPVTIGSIHAGAYDTSQLEVSNTGKFTDKSLDRAFVGQGRKTASIIADVVANSVDRKSVLIFAATQKHAQECYESLPPGLSAIVTDKTKSKDRERIVSDFTAGKIKYLVNVTIFTVGTDFPLLDHIVLMRATESSRLLMQIIGRGVRLADGKVDCLLSDYANNINTHFPDHDLFNPDIRTSYSKGGDSFIKAVCELCGTENEFSARKNDDGFEIDKHGYFVDLDGNRITSDYGHYPAHYGRRCLGLTIRGKTTEQCSYRWTSKKCPHCEADNDISARYCQVCDGEIIDPNRLLVIEYRRMKKDPYRLQCDRVLAWSQRQTISAKGNECLAIDFTTTERSFTIWLRVRSGNSFLIREYDKFMNATQGGELMPRTVTYRKEKDSNFYRVYEYNQAEDMEPSIE